MKLLERQRLSVKLKLIGMSILTSSTALLLACGAFMVYELVTFRSLIVRNLSTHAQIIAENAASALVFSDPQAATETLSPFKSSMIAGRSSQSINGATGLLFLSHEGRTSEVAGIGSAKTGWSCFGRFWLKTLRSEWSTSSRI